jgi:hypothetical protein
MYTFGSRGEQESTKAVLITGFGSIRPRSMAGTAHVLMGRESAEAR